MSDGMSDAAASARYYTQKYREKYFPELREFNPYHVPYKGKGLVIYEEWLDHILEIIENHKVMKAFKFTPSGEMMEIEPKEDLSIAEGSGIK